MKALLVTIGSLGDLHPFLAIGQALQRAGVETALALPADQVAKAQAAGIAAHAVLPAFADICARLGINEAEAARRVIEDRDFVMDEVILPSLAQSAQALDRLAVNADVIAGSVFALATGIVAEKRDIPHVAVVLQPMALFSTWQPPRIPGLGMLRRNPGPLGRGWNRFAYGAIRRALHRRYGPAVDAVRARHGLAPTRAAPMLDAAHGSAASVCAYSAAFGALPPDAPANSRITGFPFFDSDSGAEESIDPRVHAWLESGPPPVLFTLGSFASAAPGDFYRAAAEAADRLHRRALFLTGERGAFRTQGTHLTLGYAPHSHLFPCAAAIVHHGGVGTAGQALRAGRPQLVVPHFSDQFDNADRLETLGVARQLSRTRFTPSAAAAMLHDLLADPAIQAKAAATALVVARESGAEAAAACIRAAARRTHADHPSP